MTGAPVRESRWQTLALSGWGRYPLETCDVYRPERRDELLDIVAHAPQGSLLARGLGRSYGDAALNQAGGVILTERMGRLLSFDSETGVLRCEAAVSLAEVIDVFLPRGFFFPVTPGTKFISIGGAIAADVHGKNHHRDGSIASLVLDFELLTAAGEILHCSREQNVDAFWATLGGMGLTGVVLEASLQLRPVETAYLVVEYERARDLETTLARIEDDKDDAYTVAWIDCLARGRSLGRSVLMRANPATLEDLPEKRRAEPRAWRRLRRPSVPFLLPSATLNSLTMRLFNEAFYLAHGPRRVVTDYDRFFYPLDAIGHWNRAYGSRGVLQYQLQLPAETSSQGLSEVLETLAHQRRASFLSVLKSFGPQSDGLLSFPRPGQTLSLDLPFTGPDVLAVLDELDRIVVRHGGRVYLAKDARVAPDLFAQMYPRLGRFREIKARLDPEQRFASSLARRVGLVAPE